MSTTAGPGDYVHLTCQFNNTSGSAEDCTDTPTVAVLLDDGDGSPAGISGSPFNLTKIDTGYYGVRIQVPAAAVENNRLLCRFTGTCDGETPAASWVVTVREDSLTDAVLAASHGAGAWTTADCPTVEEIDAELTTNHGSGAWTTADFPTPAEINDYLVNDASHGSWAWTTAQCQGSGSRVVTLTLTCAGSPVPDVLCVVRNELETVIYASAHTDNDGVCEFQLDDDDYHVRYGPDGAYTFTNPYDLTVSGTTAKTFTCTGATQQACGLTLGEMASTVEVALRQLAHGEKAPYSIIYQWLNQAYLQMDRACNWTHLKETITTVADQWEYDRPGDVEQIVYIRGNIYTDEDGNKRTLHEVTMQELLNYQADDTVSSNIAYYAIQGDVLYVHPAPDTSGETLTLFCTGTPETMTDREDKPGIPCYTHDYLIIGALGWGYDYIGEEMMARKYRELWELKLAEEARAPGMRRGTSGTIGVITP